MKIRIKTDGSHDMGLCPCCGTMSRTVWGFASVKRARIAVYYVHWTLGEVPAHGAHFDLILGPSGDGAAAEERRAVSLAYRLFDTGPSFMVIDAAGRPFAESPASGVPLIRSEVIGTTMADLSFAVVDAILAGDRRLRDLTLMGPACSRSH